MFINNTFKILQIRKNKYNIKKFPKPSFYLKVNNSISNIWVPQLMIYHFVKMSKIKIMVKQSLYSQQK